MTTDAGAEILMHIGIDTVTLNGAPFTRARSGLASTWTPGSSSWTSTWTPSVRPALDPVTPVIVTNTDAYTKVTPHAGAAVRPGDALVDLA